MKINPSDEAISHAARCFRAALDGVRPETWKSVTIDSFPRGSCGHATEMLGRYLRHTLSIESEYVLNDLYHPDGTWRSGHAWLEYNGLVVDITGDQFGWASVIVARDSPHHTHATDNLRQPLTDDPTWWGIYCSPVYAEALGWLRENPDSC